MEMIRGKYVVFDMENHNYEQAFEDSVPEGNLNIIKVMFSLLFNKRFRWMFNEVVKYSLRHSECWRRTGSSDVYLFTCQKDYRKYWK